MTGDNTIFGGMTAYSAKDAVIYLFQKIGKIGHNPNGDFSAQIKEISEWLTKYKCEAIEFDGLLGNRTSYWHAQIQCIRALCKALKNAPTVKKLLLMNCDLSAEAISAMDLEGSSIEHLRLGDNEFTIQGILNLKLVLQKCPIKRLNLIQNELDDAGFLALGTALEGSSVSVVDIKFMQCNYERAKSLVPFILNSKLDEIDCNEFCIDARIPALFKEATSLRPYRQGIREIEVFPEPIPTIMEQYLVDLPPEFFRSKPKATVEQPVDTGNTPFQRLTL